jgi:hypothetical protein
VVVNDTNEFVWPGFDLRKIPKLNRWDYGFVPSRFFDRTVKTFDAWHLKSAGDKACDEHHEALTATFDHKLK